MKKLAKNQLLIIKEFIKNNCRPLESARYEYLFNNGNPQNIIDQLKKFKNNDGGFGKGLESDFLLPDSSPLATTVAFQILDEISNIDEEIVGDAVKYLESTFDKNRMGWFSVPEEVNNYPHAIWWHWDTIKKQTSIDESWGNPTAEIIGCLNKHKRFLNKLDINSLTEHAISYWENKTEFTSEHEVYCFIKLYKHLPKEVSIRLENKLFTASKKLVCLEVEKWTSYVPQPLQFENFVTDKIEENLDYLIDSIGVNGVWEPNWSWYQPQFVDTWEKQKIKWSGVITIQNLKYLKKYGRID